jgi:hypothetical protein
MLSRIILLLLVISVQFIEFCATKAYPDSMLEIDEPFKTLFYSLASKDTFLFRDSSNNSRMFIITKVDSVVTNTKDGFMSQEPYKLLQIELRQKQVVIHFPDTSDMVFVNKYPRTGVTSLHIEIGNYWYSVDDSLPTAIREGYNDTNDATFRLITSVPDLLKYPEDIREMYVSVRKGFIGFITLAGEKWLLQMD